MQSQQAHSTSKKLNTDDALLLDDAEDEIFSFSDLTFEDIDPKPSAEESDELPPECISKPTALNINLNSFLVNTLNIQDFKNVTKTKCVNAIKKTAKELEKDADLIYNIIVPKFFEESY